MLTEYDHICHRKMNIYLKIKNGKIPLKVNNNLSVDTQVSN